jgi:hypothetical protein
VAQLLLAVVRLCLRPALGALAVVHRLLAAAHAFLTMPPSNRPKEAPTTRTFRKEKYTDDGKQMWNQYERGEQIGKGQHGIVYKGWDVANDRREVVRTLPSIARVPATRSI